MDPLTKLLFIDAAWTLVIIIGGAFLVLATIALAFTFAQGKANRAEDEDQIRQAARMRWRDALKDSEDTYGTILRSREDQAP